MSFWKVYGILLGGIVALWAFGIALHYLETVAGGRVLAAVLFFAGLLALLAWAAKLISKE